MPAAVPVSSSPRRALYVPLQRCLSGFHLTDIVTDLRQGGPHTMIAPIDGAFDALPWSFDRLLEDDTLVEPRFDLFEYLAVEGSCEADGPLRSMRTLQGETIRIGQGLVLGQHGVGRILASVVWHGAIVHAVDACVLPSSIFRYEVDALHS